MPAKPTEHPPFGAVARAETTTKAPRGKMIGAEPQTEIVAMCRQAESLAKLMEAGADNNDPENTNIRDTAFERFCAIASEMVHYQASGPADILAKINLWRMFTVEDGLDPETAAPDEKLLISILDDVEGQLQPS